MRRLLILMSVLLLAVGCASGGGKVAPELVSRADRYFLVSPLEGFPLSVGSDVRLQLETAYRDLVEEGDRKGAEQAVAKLQERNPDLAPTKVLQAQSHFVAGAHQQVLDELAPAVARHPDYVAAQLLYGRSSEKLGELVDSLEAYAAIAESSPLARSRAVDLAPRVAQDLAESIDQSLTKGHQAEARAGLEQLQTWAPDSEATLQMAAKVARFDGDEVAELEALRRLADQRPEDEELNRRRVELELKVGDPAVGMRLIEDLAARHPESLQILEELAEARFLWRVQLLPAEVRQIAGQPELSRGDFAVVIYGLFPEVRYGRSSGARIANDILDHPQRDSLVKIINAGIMQVDPGLHRFEPYKQLGRQEALQAMLALLGSKRPPVACLEGRREPASREGICAASDACGLIETTADCLPNATVSGADALEFCRLAQELTAAE